MAFVWETVGLVALGDRLYIRLLPALSLIGIQNLNSQRASKRLRSVAEQSLLLTSWTCENNKKPIRKSLLPGKSLESHPSLLGTRLPV